MSRKISADYTPDQLMSAFGIFESGKTPKGTVSKDELVEALTTYGTNPLPRVEAEELVAQMEPGPTGLIDYKDYVDMMMRGAR